MKYLLTALLLYTSQNAYANRAVMEALPTTFNAVTIGTTTPQLLVNTTFYSGVIPTVSVKAASNVVVGADACVIYSTGSMGCSGTITGTNVPTSSGPFVRLTGDTMTGALTVSGTSVTANAFFGDGSHLTGITGTGDVTAAGNNSFTGTNTYAGTGTMLAGSTFTILGASNVETFLSSQVFSGASSFTVGLVVPSSASVSCSMIYAWNTSAGVPNIIFNGDTTGPYYSSGSGQAQSVGVISFAQDATTSWTPARTTVLVVSGFPYSTTLKYISGDSTRTTGTFQSAYENSGNGWESYNGSFQYVPVARITSMTVTASAGTMTGFIRCTYMAW